MRVSGVEKGCNYRWTGMVSWGLISKELKWRDGCREEHSRLSEQQVQRST